MTELEGTTTSEAENPGSSGEASAPESTSTETSNTPTPESTEPLQPEQTLQEKIQQKAAATGGALKPQAPLYTPNFKYKVMDKELEFDELFKGLVKDKATEEAIRQLYTKGHGIEKIKESQQQVRSELHQEREKSGQYKNVIETATGFVQKGDLHSFFQFLDIPEEKVLRYALERVQYRELSPEQRAQIDGQQSAHLRATALEQQNRSLQQSYEQVAQATRQMEITQELGRQDVQTVAQAFDARVGKPGAFQQAVIERGQWHWYTSKTDIPAAQAVREVLALVQGATPNASSINGQEEQIITGAEPRAPAQASQQTKPKIIPNIRGIGTSPVKQIPKSLSELKKIYSQKVAEDS